MMNYFEFYTNAKRRLTDTLVTLWAKGHKKEQDALRELLEEKEPLIAEPVFQTIFPWEPAKESFLEHATKMHILDEEFVQALSKTKNKEHAFPLERCPYTHQSKSWKAMLKDKKTIVVTSGTGSGKTECFIIPVLQDLYRERLKANYTEGIQAIFLYPLNALMKNQRERIDAWCSALPKQIEYAIYNGDMEESGKTTGKYPQICTRKEMREHPPQILFTNPTMLNYMMVRSKDQGILEKSKGRLRWILLDEAHTYTGSAATELALQIRRVLSAFDVTVDQVNFAVTSATMGGKEAEENLKKVISQLTDKPLEKILVINGNRIIPNMNENVLEEQLEKINKKFELQVTKEKIHELRRKLNKSPALSSKDIAKELGYNKEDLESRLKLVNDLSTETESLGNDGKALALLPTRAHFFIRVINGIYACVNPKCKSITPNSLPLGSFTTYQNTKCKHCNSNMVEVASCLNCGEMLIVGEEHTKDGYRLRTNEFSLEENPFEIDTLELETEENEIEKQKSHGHYEKFILGMPGKKNPRGIKPDYFSFDLEKSKRKPFTPTKEGVYPKGVYQNLRDPNSGADLCPCCGNALGNKLGYLKISAIFFDRILASTILDNATPMLAADRNKDTEILYEGRKYITFTDSRQGTAKFSMGINQDVQRNIIRSNLYHYLADLQRNEISNNEWSAEDQQKYEYCEKQKDLPPFLQKEFDELKTKKNNSGEPVAPSIPWDKIKKFLEQQADINRIYKFLKNARYNTTNENATDGEQLNGFLDALFLDQFGWIPRNANSLENLGLIHIVYPTLKKAKAPDELKRLNFSDSDWQDFLKIALDYQIRGNKHWTVPNNTEPYLMQAFYAKPIYPPDSSFTGVNKWPRLDIKTKPRSLQPKLVLLLMAALEKFDLNTDNINFINKILNDAWKYIRDNFLTEVDQTNKGYRLNILDKDKIHIQIIEKGFKCPVDNVVVDTLFKGYSPRMRGYATKENMDRFKVSTEAMKFPYFPYANRKMLEDANKTKVDITRDEVSNWIATNWKAQKEAGIFGNIHLQILYPTSIFMAAEHSAQQQSNVLENYEQEFNSGHLNILSCSTTMEMGVDLKGISAVVLNSVPPKPANYQQRAGRAGRRGETKALTLTFCSATPIGINAWQNPIWPLAHKTEIPVVNLSSNKIIQKHINAFLFETYVQKNGGMLVKENLNEFFEKNIDDSENKNPGPGYEDFKTFLSNLHSQIFLHTENEFLNSLKKKFDNLVSNTGLNEQSLLNSIKCCEKEIKNIFESYNNKKTVLDDAWKSASDSSTRKAIEEKQNKLKNTSLLPYLAELNFLPSAGIPTGLVEFNNACKDSINKKLHNKNKLPTQHLSRAISMYAPGTPVVINNWCYESKGIAMKTKFDASKRGILQSCSKCGYITIVEGNTFEKCPKCESIVLKSKEIIEPAGFSVDWQGTCHPKQRIKTDNSFSLVQPLLLKMKPWQKEDSDVKMKIRTSEESEENPEILFYNKGANENGYMFCPHCGRMESEVWDNGESFQKFINHKHLETGGACEGSGHDGAKIRRNVLLVGRYQTDFAEIKFFDENNKEINDPATLYSLGVIIKQKLTEVLGLNDGDIDFGYNTNYKSVFVYDTNLGGSGYSPLLSTYKDEVLNLARKALSKDNCTKACTKCLVEKSSQWYLNYLDRKKALEWLEMEYKTRSKK